MSIVPITKQHETFLLTSLQCDETLDNFDQTDLQPSTREKIDQVMRQFQENPKNVSQKRKKSEESLQEINQKKIKTADASLISPEKAPTHLRIPEGGGKALKLGRLVVHNEFAKQATRTYFELAKRDWGLSCQAESEEKADAYFDRCGIYSRLSMEQLKNGSKIKGKLFQVTRFNE